jgi:ATP-binding cassette subfamily G (WHITE) protein 2 (SNQ2)
MDVQGFAFHLSHRRPFRSRFVFRFGFRIELNLLLAVSGQAIICTSAELVPIVPPSGLSCADYMDPFMSYAGGYLANPNATSNCLYCPFQTTDQYMYVGFNIEYAHRWRDVGIMLGVTLFNVSCAPCCSLSVHQDIYFSKVVAIFALTYVFRIRKGNFLSLLKRKL